MRAAAGRFGVFVACAAWLAGGVGTAAASELANLIETGQRRQAIALIEAGADVNETQGDGSSPLLWAAYRVDTELAALLIARGADPDGMNSYGASPLGEAVKVAAVEIVEMLLAAGADAHALNGDGQTALMLAARSGSTAIVELLLEHGADVNARERWRGQSALMWAADARFPEIVALLIEHGAEVDFRAESIDWPSQITSEPRAQYRPVGGLTPLLYATRSGCTACVEAIVAAGADIDRPTPEGMTPLMLALDNEAPGTAARLLELGANPHLWDWYGRTALYIAADKSSVGRGRRGGGGDGRGGGDGGDNGGGAGRGGTDGVPTGLDLIERLLEAGVDPNPQLNMHRPSRGGNIGRFTDDLLTTGCTPLLRLAVSQDTDAIRLLLAHGALVDLPNVMGVTPLMAVAGMGGGRGGVFSTDFGNESLALEIVDVLLEAGADVNARVVDAYDHTATIARGGSMAGREGQTALITAVIRGRVQLVEFLLENGADASIADASGNTALEIARARVSEDEDGSDQASRAIVALLEGRVDRTASAIQ